MKKNKRIEIMCIDKCMPIESIYENKGIGKCKVCERENVELGKIIVKDV